MVNKLCTVCGVVTSRSGSRLHHARSTVEPEPAQRPVQHAGLAAPQRASTAGMARPARELVPGLRARRPSGHRPDRRSHRAARSRRRAARHRQLRRALPVVQLDQGCVARDAWGPAGWGTHVRTAQP